MRVNTYLNFNGTCAAALQFYAETLGGKISFIMTFGDSPMADQVPPEMKDKIMHATLALPGGAVLMGADHPHGKHVHPTGFCVSIHVTDMPEAERIFSRLSEGGHVQLPLQKTFWAPGFGMCTDQFEVPWMINCVPA